MNNFCKQAVLLVMLLISSSTVFALSGGSEPHTENTIIIGTDTDKDSSENDNSDSALIAMLPINDDISSLMARLNTSKIRHKRTTTVFKKLLASKASLNPAEHYLLHVAQIKLLTYQTNIKVAKKDQVIIEALAKELSYLSSKISGKQIAQPNFIQLHTILANYYARQRQYDLAYTEVQKYLDKYHLYRQDRRKNVLASLEKSFDVGDKKASNVLLKIQNELKIREVEVVKNEKVEKKYNVLIIISTILLFVLLFFRQLKIRRELIKLTRTDSLTQVANRNALFEKGIQMVSDFETTPQELSVLLLDIDHFKQINDSFGHNAGDKVLVIVSELIQEAMRSRDVFARLGGEEFVALLPFADTHKAKAIAMRVNEKIQQYDFSTFMLQKRVTISIGVASLVSNQMSFDDLLHCADLAMYQAKEQGRNTVVCYEQISMLQERRSNNLIY